MRSAQVKQLLDSLVALADSHAQPLHHSIPRLNRLGLLQIDDLQQQVLVISMADSSRALWTPKSPIESKQNSNTAVAALMMPAPTLPCRPSLI